MTAVQVRAPWEKPTVDEETARNISASWFVDLLREVEAQQAEARAATFEWARPRPGEWMGRATPEQIRARDRRLQGIAQAYRNKAALLRYPRER